MSFSDEEIFEELGIARGRRVEFFGDGYSFGRLAKVDTLEAAFVNQLYWRKWRAEHVEQARGYVAKYARSAKGRAVNKAKKQRWQQRHRDQYNAAQRAAYARRTLAQKARTETAQ